MVRGELKLLWSFSDGADEADSKKTDETIEAPSETAMKARAAVAADKVEELAEEIVEHVQEEGESWMNGDGVGTPDQGKARRRKGGKKK